AQVRAVGRAPRIRTISSRRMAATRIQERSRRCFSRSTSVTRLRRWDKICGLLDGTFTDTAINAITSGPKATATPNAQRAICEKSCVTFQPAPGASPVLQPPAAEGQGRNFSVRASHVRLLGLTFGGTPYDRTNQISVRVWPQDDEFATAQTPD